MMLSDKYRPATWADVVGQEKAVSTLQRLFKSGALLEGLDGRPLAQYVRLIQDCRNNLRMALSRIEAGEMLA